MKNTKIKLVTELEAEITNESIKNEDDRFVTIKVYECCECHGRFVGEVNRSVDGYNSQGTQTPNFCPTCGEKLHECDNHLISKKENLLEQDKHIKVKDLLEMIESQINAADIENKEGKLTNSQLTIVYGALGVLRNKIISK